MLNSITDADWNACFHRFVTERMFESDFVVEGFYEYFIHRKKVFKVGFDFKNGFENYLYSEKKLSQSAADFLDAGFDSMKDQFNRAISKATDRDIKCMLRPGKIGQLLAAL